MEFRYVTPVVCPFELAVQEAGYPWVRTQTLQKTRFNGLGQPEPFDPSRPDRLGHHEHHGPNTHLIIHGDLKLHFFRMETARERSLSSKRSRSREAAVAPKKGYFARSEDGCAFVEGHRCLSPVSAARFMRDGKIEAVPKNGPREGWPSQETIQGWLAPGGLKDYFHPGETPILEWPGMAMSPDESLARANIEAFFSKEWEPDNTGQELRRIEVDKLPYLG